MSPSVRAEPGKGGICRVGGRRQVPGEPTGPGWGTDTWGSGPEEAVVQILSADLWSFIFLFAFIRRALLRGAKN